MHRAFEKRDQKTAIAVAADGAENKMSDQKDGGFLKNMI